jgi:hypothetical protein
MAEKRPIRFGPPHGAAADGFARSWVSFDAVKRSRVQATRIYRSDDVRARRNAVIGCRLPNRRALYMIARCPSQCVGLGSCPQHVVAHVFQWLPPGQAHLLHLVRAAVHPVMRQPCAARRFCGCNRFFRSRPRMPGAPQGLDHVRASPLPARAIRAATRSRVVAQAANASRERLRRRRGIRVNRCTMGRRRAKVWWRKRPRRQAPAGHVAQLVSNPSPERMGRVPGLANLLTMTGLVRHAATDTASGPGSAFFSR